MIQLSEAQQSPGIRRVLGTCPTSQDATDLISEAARRLRRRGDFAETIVPLFVCVYNGCLVTPRYVGAIRRVNYCNQAVPVENAWFRFMWGAENRGWRGLCGQEVGLSQAGYSPVFQDVQGEGRTIRAYPRCQADIGKTLTIFGTDNNGQPLIHQDSTGAWVPGAVITLVSPFGSTNTFVRKIDYVTKDKTQQIVDVYAYNATTNLLEDIAHYEPQETTPTYQKQKVSIPFPACGTSTAPNCCGAKRGVLMLVKIAAIDPVNPTDLICIPNVDALKLMIMAIRAEEATDRDLARGYEKDAIEVLNRELEDLSPDETFAASNNTLGPGVWSNSCF